MRTAYRVRAGTVPIASLSFAALRGDGLVGDGLSDDGLGDDGLGDDGLGDEGTIAATIQCWPVELRAADRTIPLIMVGPVAVDPRWQQAGLGKRIMRHMLDHAAHSALPGAEALMLIGDQDYYGRFFGFSADRTAGWRLPGPFDRDRLLARGDQVPALAGDIHARFVRSDLPNIAPMP